LFPLAAAYLAWTAFIGNNAFIQADFALRLVMMAAGPITAIPLLLFAAGARRIRLSTLGLLQFIAPTLQLLLGIWMFHEPFGGARMWGFVIIWGALALYSAEGLLRNWWSEPQAAATSHAPATD
jgi:chloramphenicol-sensitive protein RarD